MAKKKAGGGMKRRTFWIGRDKGSRHGSWYAVLTPTSRMAHLSGLWTEAKKRMCPSDFQRITGVRLKPGERAKFRLERVR